MLSSPVNWEEINEALTLTQISNTFKDKMSFNFISTDVLT